MIDWLNDGTGDWTLDPRFIQGVPDAPLPPQGSNTDMPPAMPVTTTGPDVAQAGAVQSAVAAGAAVTAGPVWRQPAFQAVALAALGVAIIGHASYVAGKV